MNKDEIQNNINIFLSQVESNLCNHLRSKKSHFPSVDKLFNKFNNQRERWKKDGPNLINDIVAMTNELCVADLILRMERCNRLYYEPSPNLTNSKETIDFCVSMNDGNIIYCDVKTIQPIVQDDWEKFIKYKQFFPKNTDVVLYKDGLGGEIWHNYYNSRQSMFAYTQEFENKILTCSITNKTYFVMIFCGDGFAWQEDHLEDFADFYSAGKHNPDDAFSKMENKFIADKNIKLLKNINCFAYMERSKTEIKVNKFVCPVRGPWIENKWVAVKRL